MTLFAGTGHTAFSTLPVIAEVAKREGIRPSRPLSIATVASQIAITASPISAAVVFFSGELEKFGVDYVQLLLITIPSSFLAVMIGAVVANFQGKDLKDDPIYQDRLAKGLVKTIKTDEKVKEISSEARRSVLISANVRPSPSLGATNPRARNLRKRPSPSRARTALRALAQLGP